MRPTAEERFWSKVDKSGACWLWTGSTRGGYAQFHPGGRGVSPIDGHRFVYELLVGPIPGSASRSTTGATTL